MPVRAAANFPFVGLGYLLVAGCVATDNRSPVSDEQAILAAFEHIQRSHDVSLQYFSAGGVGLKSYPVVPYRSFEAFKARNPDCCVIGIVPNDNGWPKECEQKRSNKALSLIYMIQYRGKDGSINEQQRTETVFVDPEGKVCGALWYY